AGPAAHQPSGAFRSVRDHRRSEHRRRERSEVADLEHSSEDAVPRADRHDHGAACKPTVVMDWMSWKPWTALALILIAVFAIYTFAATDRGAGPLPERTVRTPQHTAAGGPRVAVSAPGVGLVHMEWLDMPS